MKKYDFLNKETFNEQDLYDIVYALCDEDGCPWDKVQTHESIKKSAIEESYELAQAITKWDLENVIEELGDVYLQVVFHIVMAQKNKEFTKQQVYNALANKLISRHTHVFGNVVANSEAEALDNWNKNKKVEHKINTLSEYLDDVPEGMSALMKAQKVQNRASKSGYDFSSVEQATQKVREELEEFLAETNDAKKHVEGGDLLFAVVNLLRLSNVDSETAILDSTIKFKQRVKTCEDILNGNSVKNLSQQEFDAVWEKAKEQNNG